jgi:5-carboxymethyl-2-hydroxymuconate isomerase
VPHLTIEYSANLDERADLPALCETLRGAMLATGLFETGAVRVRAVRCEAYAVADALPDNAFADLVLRVGAGRDRAALSHAGDAIFAAAKACLAPLFDTPHFALSFEIREIDPELSWKTNAMHARLRGT